MKNLLKVFAIFFALGLLVYFNSLNNKFLMDDYFFLSNPVTSTSKFVLSQWNPYQEQSAGVLDNHESLEYYRPLAHIAYDLFYASFKNNYWQYHLSNLFLFVFASSLLFLLIERLTGNYILAFLTGAFYLIHPINGIVVNYISASVFAFQVICTLATILLLWESLERKNDRLLYGLSLFFSFLSLFWNESGVMTPFYISAVILLFRKEPFKDKALYLSPYFLIVIFYLIFRLFFISLNEIVFKQIGLFHLTGCEYVANLFRVFIWYLSRLFYPQGIVMQWVTPIVHDHMPWYIFGAISLFVAFLLFLARFAKQRILQLAISWILIGFAPVCLVAFKRPDHGAQIEPHWLIISSIGFFILFAYFCMKVFERTKSGGVVIIAILILIWGVVSHEYNQLWADQKTYALYCVQQVPELKNNYFYLADAYSREGDYKDSREYYRLALSGYPNDVEIYNNIGTMDQAEANWKEAIFN